MTQGERIALNGFFGGWLPAGQLDAALAQARAAASGQQQTDPASQVEPLVTARRSAVARASAPGEAVRAA